MSSKGGMLALSNSSHADAAESAWEVAVTAAAGAADAMSAAAASAAAFMNSSTTLLRTTPRATGVFAGVMAPVGPGVPVGVGKLSTSTWACAASVAWLCTPSLAISSTPGGACWRSIVALGQHQCFNDCSLAYGMTERHGAAKQCGKHEFVDELSCCCW